MSDAVTLLAAASDQQGPGNVLRIVLVVTILGAAGLAWLLLRGYRSTDDETTGEPTTAEPAAERAEDGRSGAESAARD
ncbi:hypothetical protein [Streptomyces sp. CBMA152]|uniref:hypothetical protein n=1 Tax=Streptomyces sp. CBMA152 TaxID=1896312 RepID=UPI00166143B8|nr:hypothetical protein [Streptomyces sp. CBMA152]MBD0747280.1 hypothetical protein [Streptomyces sp. CBMA152]